ncbi:hypothetical protein CYMTET_11866 [Cymbomonas tetramitiformis]|uniref:Uncharacterized protein n=1 Tax=Cymbomonas tetramitiformis TaxID=36881 RepID=A0AAE0GLH8_9CHLO|nr:hypothetical protein CYMTET_11866 [Cymbomonas tetramitiformis]
MSTGGVFQADADDGAAAFAAAVEQHGAPAVARAGATSGGVDISVYGFTTAASEASGDDEMDVQEELRDLRHQIGEAISMGQVSVSPEKSPSFAGVSAESRRPMMPLAGGALSEAGGAPPSFMTHVTVPTEEFPGGVDLLPLRHPVPTVSVGAPLSAVACSIPQEKASFVDLEGKSRAPSIIEDLFSDTDGEDFPPPIYEAPCVQTYCGVSAVLRLFAAAGGGMAAAAPGGDLASEHGGVTTWDVP